MNYYTGKVAVWSRYHSPDDERFIVRADSEQAARAIVVKQIRAAWPDDYQIQVDFDRTINYD